MRKVTCTIRRVILFYTLLLLIPASLAAGDGSLLEKRIQYADEATLAQMAGERNLPLGDERAMRSALYAYHQLTESPYQAKANQRVSVHIDEASSVHSISSSLFIIEGGVQLTVTAIDGTSKRTIEADSILVDIDHQRLSAYGSVRYDDQGEAGYIEAEALSWDWEAGDLAIVDALMVREHEQEKRQLTIYSQAREVESISLGEVTTYRDGVIATRVDDPLSSIRAERMVFRPGGDLIIKNATLNIGRVPLLWLPFFPFINNRMVGNPAVGINSDRGMFVSTTWEIFGRYPKIGEADQSEALALLAKQTKAERYPGSIIYSAAGPDTALERWAEASSSYLAITADAYERRGVALGLESSISLFSKRLSISGLGMVALDPAGVEQRSTYAMVAPLRYYAEPTIAYDSKNSKVRLELPLYSDPSVKSLYANRLSAFTIEGPMGKAMEFPTTYGGDINQTQWRLTSSFSAPTQYTRPYLTSLSIPVLNAQITRQYKKDGDTYSWQYTAIEVPDASVKAAGTPLSLRRTLTSKEVKEDKAGPVVPQERLLTPFYKASEKESKRVVNTTQELTLSYSLEGRYNQRFDPKTLDPLYRYSFSKAAIRLFGTPHSRLLTIAEELSGQLSIVEDTNKKTFYNQEGQIFLTSRLAIPIVGLEYQVSQRLVRQQITEDDTARKQIDEAWAFNAEQVTVHRISLGSSYPLFAAVVRPSLTVVLPPLKQSLLAQVSVGYRGVTLSASLSYQEKDGHLNAERFSAALRYSDQLFSFDLEGRYRLSEVAASVSDLLSITQNAAYKSSSGFLKVSQSLVYEGLSKAKVAHWIERLTLKAEIPHLLLHYTAHGPIDGLKSLEMKGSVSLIDQSLRFYKGRIALFWGVDTSLYFHFEDHYASRLEFKAHLGLSIAEFLDCSLSVKSVNTGFYRYYEGDQVRLGLLWQDLLRSFDFGGDGRHNTQFNLNSIDFDFSHDLGDWSLNCKYNASVVLSNNQYRWVPTVSVFLCWKVLSELDIEERWTQDNVRNWVRSDAT